MSVDPGPFRPDLRVEVEPIGPQTPEPAGRWWGTRPMLVACAVAALVAWGLLASRGVDAPWRGGPAPVRPPIDLAALEYQALRLVGIEPDLAPDLPAAWSGPVLAAGLARTFGSQEAPFPAGRYLLRLACVGSGHVSLRWSPGGATGALEVACTADGGGSAQELDLPAPGRITVTVGTRDVDDNRASFAVALTDPRAVTAQRILGDGPSVLAGDELNIASMQWTTEHLSPGGYHLTLVCVGTGRLQVRLWFGPVQETSPNSLWLGVGAQSSQEVACSADGARLELDIAGATGSTLSVVVMEIGGPPATSGYAFRVERLP